MSGIGLFDNLSGEVPRATMQHKISLLIISIMNVVFDTINPLYSSIPFT